jgi:hypothetical protein
MLTVMAALAAGAIEEAKRDVILEMVLQFLASYLGIAFGVSLIVELAKWVARDWAKPKAPVLTILLVFLLGSGAKCIMPDAYGPHTFKAWTLHLIVLMFCAIIAAAFHDRIWNVVKGKLGAIIPGGAEPPPGDGGGKPPAEGGKP